jgi:hypothetical protein
MTRPRATSTEGFSASSKLRPVRLVALGVGLMFVLSSGATARGNGPSPLLLRWAPPTLSNPVTISVSNANRRLFLDDTRDYRLNIVEPLKRELWIEGGRNVVVIGGHITIDQLGTQSSYQDNTAVKVRYGNPSGTVHLEGLLIDGPYVNDGIGIATARNVQIENVRVERAYDMIKNGHADCVQIQQGVGALRMDRFTCSTGRQGVYLGDLDGPIGSADLRHVNMYAAGGNHLFFQVRPLYPVAISEMWLAIAPGFSPYASFGYWVFPQLDGRTLRGDYDRSRRAIVGRHGQRLWFVGSNIRGVVRKGRPRAGDMVPAAVAGSGYSSPGYVASKQQTGIPG